MVKRTDFTESDDENLLEYIARKKPENSGRLGNNLYILLAESGDRRSWAKRHSWQSWRERYKKNQAWFDYQIKKHQRKLGVGGTAKGEVKTKRNKPEPKSTVNGDNKHTTDKGKSASNVEKLKLSQAQAQAQAQVDKPDKEKHDKQTSSLGKGDMQAMRTKPEAKPIVNEDKRTTDKGKSESNVEKLKLAQAQAQDDKPEKEKHDKQTSSVGKEGVQTTRIKPEAKPIVNEDKRTTDKGKSESNVEKLAQAQTQDDKPEKEKHNKQTSSVPPASSSETETEDLYVELFGISQFSEDNEDEPLDTHEKSLVPSSSNLNQDNIYPCIESVSEPGTVNKEVHIPRSNVNQDNIYPSIENVPQPGTVDKEVHIPRSLDGVVKIEPTPIIFPTEEPVHKSDPSSGRKSIATSATDTLQPHRPPHDKKKILPRDDDSNFFATPSPSPLATNSFAGGKPPMLHEGPYRNSQKRIRATSGDVTNDESWPPKRRKKMVEDIDMNGPKVEMSGTGDARSGVETKGAVPVTLSATGNTNELARRRPPTPVNAAASSSKVLLHDPPKKPTKPTNLLKVIYAKGTPSTDTNHQDKFPANSFIQTAANNGPESVLTDAAPRPNAMKDTRPPFIVKKRKPNERVASSSSHPIKRIHRLITTPNTGTATHQLARISPVDADDPFIVSKSIDKTSDDEPRRIDLRPSLKKNAIRRSSNFSTRTSTSSTSRQSVTPFLLPEDQEVVNQVGFSEVMAVIAKHYGFDVDVAMNAFFATKSIEKTKTVLQHAKEVANSATSILLAELVNKTNGDEDVDSYDDEEPRSTWRGRSSSNRKDQSASPGRQKAKRFSGPRNAKRPSLNINIRPQLFDEMIEQNGLSDYSPPRDSRAGQYMRLVKQGRRKEAVDRERRRASGTFVAETQFQSPYEKNHRQSLSLMPNSSPTPNADQEEPMVIDGRSSDDDDNDNDNDNDNDDPDDFQPPVATPHEDTAQHQPQGDVSLPIDPHRIFIKRISEGQSTLNEDEDEPAVVKLAQEHRDLVMNVTEENADALRSFEQENNPDLLRLWSLDWARQTIANI